MEDLGDALFSILVDESRDISTKETFEAVTVIETPLMIIVGVVKYVKTPRDLCTLNTVWDQHLSEEGKMRFYKNW